MGNSLPQLHGWAGPLEISLDLFAQPAQVTYFLRHGCLGCLPDHHAGEVGDIRTQSMDVPMAFHENFDVESHQALEGIKPLPAVHIGVRRREIRAHEGVPCQQHLLSRLVQHDVVVAVAGSFDDR